MPSASPSSPAAPPGAGARQPSFSGQPKGILKRPEGQGEPRSPHLSWDEPNLALNDLNRDSTMKITEPKTPFVRYNPETDEVMNMDSIPDFNLGRSTSSSSEVNSQAASGPVRPPSRRSSESSEKRQVFVERPDGGVGATGQDGTDEEEAFQDPESKAKHDAFLRARKGHYGNEAEAMKIARALAEDEEAVQDDEDGDADVPAAPARVNGA